MTNNDDDVYSFTLLVIHSRIISLIFELLHSKFMKLLLTVRNIIQNKINKSAKISFCVECRLPRSMLPGSSIPMHFLRKPRGNVQYLAGIPSENGKNPMQ